MPERRLQLYTTEKITKKDDLNPGILLVGTAVRWELENPVFFASEVHKKLLEEENVAVISQSQILEDMQAGVTVVKAGDDEEFLGYVGLKEDEEDPRIIVAGSWVSNWNPRYQEGSGTQVMQHAAELALNSRALPHAERVIARVKADNIRPQQKLFSMGARRKTMTPIISPITHSPVHVWDLTKVGRRGVYS